MPEISTGHLHQILHVAKEANMPDLASRSNTVINFTPDDVTGTINQRQTISARTCGTSLSEVLPEKLGPKKLIPPCARWPSKTSDADE